MLAFVLVLDAISLAVGLRPLLARSVERHIPVMRLLWRGTDPAITTVVLSSAAGVTGGVLAAAGLAGWQITGRPGWDTAASALISLILLATSAVLLHTNRDLLTGRGLSPSQVERLREIVKGQPGVLGVPDIFGVVVGPASIIVDGDVVFEDGLDVPAVEAVIVATAAALRAELPAITFVYLNPVAARRPRRTVGPG